jgi:hypothetical protein
LIDHAQAMAVAAAKYEKTFVDAGLPTDFLAKLSAAVVDLRTALTNKGASKNKQSGATAGIRAEAGRGQGAVKVLDSIIEPALSGNQPLLAEWKGAKRFAGKAKPIPSTTLDSASAGATGSTTADPAGSSSSNASTATGSPTTAPARTPSTTTSTSTTPTPAPAGQTASSTPAASTAIGSSATGSTSVGSTPAASTRPA